MSRSLRLTSLLAAALLGAAAAPAHADHRVTYEVTVTNITYNQRFTPVLLAAHRPSITLFQLGAPASAELRTLAEEGNVGPLKAVLDASPEVQATAAGNSLLDPGKSVTFRIQANPWRDRLSMAAMLIPTNDAFASLNAVGLPFPGGSAVSYTAVAYDSGTEVNDELCTSIPGPSFVECNGSGGGARVGGGEGFVHVHRGMHGVGQFRATDRDWRNPVAKVVIRQVR
jgi:Spondin_N